MATAGAGELTLEGAAPGRPPSRGWPFGRVLALLVVCNLLLGVALFSLRAPWYTPPAVTPRPELPASVRALQARLASGQRGEAYSLSLSDDELTAVAGYYLQDAPDIPFTRIRIAVSGDRLIVDGITKGLAVTVPVRVVGNLTARDGLPLASVDDVSLGDTALPAFVRNQILAEANKSLDLSRYPLPITVEAAELRPGGLTVRGAFK